MKAQINKINEASVVVSLYNEKRIVSQKWFDTEKKKKQIISVKNINMKFAI